MLVSYNLGTSKRLSRNQIRANVLLDQSRFHMYMLGLEMSLLQEETSRATEAIRNFGRQYQSSTPLVDEVS